VAHARLNNDILQRIRREPDVFCEINGFVLKQPQAPRTLPPDETQDDVSPMAEFRRVRVETVIGLTAFLSKSLLPERVLGRYLALCFPKEGGRWEVKT
jgi:hypothetical protein